ncbi:glutamate--cysteine ligase [Streptomyces sp. NPDC002574]|uniref:carboxylate-amine ligase n=1 Tax=Streptomyces sp. NPDC002574 TaxID=3364652 RepID=UPI0036C3031F
MSSGSADESPPPPGPAGGRAAMTTPHESASPPRPVPVPVPGRTLGVEEEFLLVDAGTRRIAGLAGAVIERARRTPPPAPDAVLQRELSAAQIEAATGVTTDLPELVRQLDGARRTLAAAARAEGGRLVSTGLPVLDGAAPVTGGERFTAIARLYEHQAASYLACGCHVHVGVPDPETAVAVVNWLRPWLPTLLALSANSPWDRGRDSGYASWRVMEQARFPGSGIPPRFGSAAEHAAEVARLVECGVLVDPRMTFWLARPSPHLPTVEVRVADALGTTWETALQAALTRALVSTALADLAAGREAPPVPAQLASAALWTAARFGLDGPAVDPVHETRVPARALLDRLLAHLAPALEAAGDLPFVRGALSALHRHGTGAARQRHAGAPSGPAAAVDMLAAQTDGALAPGG